MPIHVLPDKKALLACMAGGDERAFKFKAAVQ